LEIRCPEKHFKAQKLWWPESPVKRRALVSSPPSTILKSQAFGSFSDTKADCSQGKKNLGQQSWFENTKRLEDSTWISYHQPSIIYLSGC